MFQLDTGAGRLQRIAGTGEQGLTGDGGPGSTATFNGPKGIAYSAADHSLYIVDTENHAIRRLSLATGIIETVLGTGERGDGPDGDPMRCQLARPHGVFVHQGVVYVTDSENHRVRGAGGSSLKHARAEVVGDIVYIRGYREPRHPPFESGRGNDRLAPSRSRAIG